METEGGGICEKAPGSLLYDLLYRRFSCFSGYRFFYNDLIE